MRPAARDHPAMFEERETLVCIKTTARRPAEVLVLYCERVTVAGVLLCWYRSQQPVSSLYPSLVFDLEKIGQISV